MSRLFSKADKLKIYFMVVYRDVEHVLRVSRQTIGSVRPAIKLRYEALRIHLSLSDGDEVTLASNYLREIIKDGYHFPDWIVRLEITRYLYLYEGRPRALQVLDVVKLIEVHRRDGLRDMFKA